MATSRHGTRPFSLHRRRPRLATAILIAVALIAAQLSGTQNAWADEPAPSVLPALQSWTPASGSLTLSRETRVVVDGDDDTAMANARTFAEDLRAEKGWPASVVTKPTSAKAGDIVLIHDNSRKDLGAEGYALKISDRVEITGGSSAGLFYGTRTVLQLLSQRDRLAAGSTVDVPKYAERGVAVCACYTYNTVAWFDRLIKDMAYLKLNLLHLELKVRSDEFPKINTFSYYTPDEIKHIVATATKYHVAVKPEINSPGHIDPYIANYPDLQLVGKDGKADPSRLDITKPEAFTFYTKLIDAYLKLFPGKFWHMGADEYMLGSAYDNYPQLLAYAQQKYGPNAVAQDAYIDFINRVDDYVKSKGKTLRIWNDGLTGANTVPVNPDILVEYWTSEPVTAQDLLDQGHTLLNATNGQYYIRGGSHIDAKGTYDSNWSPLVFPGGTVAAGQAVSGAELTVWPDNYTQETENTAQEGLFAPLRVFAQAVWGSPKPTADYTAFESLANSLGHAPGWGPAWVRPLKAGSYVIKHSGRVLVSPTAADDQLVAQEGKQTWRLEPTDDGYYRMVSDSAGLCADIRNRGTGVGGIELEGTPVTAQTCDGRATQRWQVEKADGGFRIVNAITQEAANDQNGMINQQPRDVASDAVWTISPTSYVAPGITVTADSPSVQPGASTDVTVTIDNTSGGQLKDAEVTITASDGWTLKPAAADLGTIARGAKITTKATLTAPSHNATTTLTATATYAVNGTDDRVDAVTPIVAKSANSVYSQSYEGPSYKRLTREVDVPADGGSVTFWTDYVAESWDFLFVEARTPGQDDWTTLPDANGHTSTDPGPSCGAGWVPWRIDLSKYAGETVEISIAYVSDWGGQEKGVYVDDVTLPDGTTSGFEDGELDGWTVPGAPAGEPANPNDFVVTATP